MPRKVKPELSAMRSGPVTFCGNQKINEECLHGTRKYTEAAVNAEFMGHLQFNFQ